jgi:hypothetical protein
MLVISIIVAILFTPIDPLGLGKLLDNQSYSDLLVGGIYTIIVMVLLYLFVLLVNLINEHRDNEDNKLVVMLTEFRTKGVDIRNGLSRVETEEELEILIQQYQVWDPDMLGTLEKLSPGKAGWLRTLDTMPDKRITGAINQEQNRYYKILCEKLVRLDKIIKQYLDLPEN